MQSNQFKCLFYFIFIFSENNKSRSRSLPYFRYDMHLGNVCRTHQTLIFNILLENIHRDY